MSSKVYNNADASKQSASCAQLEKDAAKKPRTRYSFPTKATHLSDQQAVRSGQMAHRQFHKSARSITPPPGVTNWAPKNRMMVDIDGTQQLSRQARPKRSTNILSASAAASAPVALDIRTSHGGSPAMKEMMRVMLLSGKFDDEVESYNQLRSSGSAPRRVNLRCIHNEAEDQRIYVARAESREAADKKKSPSKIAADPNIGVATEQMAEANIFARVGNLV